MKSAVVALQCSGAGAPEVVQHFYQIFFRVHTYINSIQIYSHHSVVANHIFNHEYT